MDGVLRSFFGKFSVVITAALGTITTADQEEVFDGSSLDALNDFIRHAEDGIMPEAGKNFLARILFKPITFLGLLDDR